MIITAGQKIPRHRPGSQDFSPYVEWAITNVADKQGNCQQMRSMACCSANS